MLFVIPLCIAIYDRTAPRDFEDTGKERKVLTLWPIYVLAFMMLSRCIVISIRHGCVTKGNYAAMSYQVSKKNASTYYREVLLA